VRRRLINETDRRLAAIPHLIIGLWLFIGIGFLVGLAIDLVIWLRKRHSPFVEFHAEQAGTYQFTVFILNVLFVVIWLGGIYVLLGGSQIGEGLLSTRQLLMGGWLSLIGLFIIWYFGTIFYGMYAGVKIALGRDFEYPIIGKRVQRRMEARAAKHAKLKTE